MRIVGWVMAAILMVALGTLGSRLLNLQPRARWEARAARADSLAVVAQAEAATARAEADSLRRVVVRQDTVIRWRVRRVAEVDSIHPPAEDCLPNIRERDALIAALQEQRVTLEQENAARGRALLILSASHDTLQRTLAARPRPSALHGPSVGVGVFAGVCANAQPCAGVGITINLGGFKLR